MTLYTAFTNYVPAQDQQSLFESPKVAVSLRGHTGFCYCAGPTRAPGVSCLK